MEKNIWFKRKQHGWGWFPATWQGWIIILLFIGITTAPTFIFPKGVHDHIIMFLIYVFMLSGGLIYICMKTGESPKWQWGNKKDKN
jgi:hypothetical protein